jgi:DNA-binding MarR family transcriptional regulator
MIITRFTVQKDSGGYLDPSSFHDETMAHAITPNDRTDVEALLSALRPFANLRQRPAALRTVAAFLTIATNEGRALNDYARALKIHRAYMSRIVHDLCDLARNGGQGLGLIEIREEKRGKRLEILLTDRGRAIAEAMRCQQMLLALRPFSKMPPITVRTVTVLLIIAANEGKSPADIARLLKLNRADMSKTIYGLADRKSNGGPGLGLIQIAEVSMLNQKQALFLTNQGRAVVEEMLAPLRSQ